MSVVPQSQSPLVAHQQLLLQLLLQLLPLQFQLLPLQCQLQPLPQQLLQEFLKLMEIGVIGGLGVNVLQLVVKDPSQEIGKEGHTAYIFWGILQLLSYNRACNSPPPNVHGKPCEGSDTETASCNLKTCPPRVDFPEECGLRKARGITRITNGQPAPKGGWPWQVAIGYKDPSNGNIDYLCGATLITKR